VRHYNQIKNITVAVLVGFIYRQYIVPGIPVLDKLFALAFVCWAALGFLDYLDAKKIAKVRARRKEKGKNEMSASADSQMHSRKSSI